MLRWHGDFPGQIIDRIMEARIAVVLTVENLVSPV